MEKLQGCPVQEQTITKKLPLVQPRHSLHAASGSRAGAWRLTVRKCPCWTDACHSGRPSRSRCSRTPRHTLSPLPARVRPHQASEEMTPAPPTQKVPSQLSQEAVWHPSPRLAFVHDWVRCVSENVCPSSHFRSCFVKLWPTYPVVFGQSISQTVCSVISCSPQ